MIYLKVEVFIPQENVAILVNKLNEKGLLLDGNYDYVYCEIPVRGHFRPLEGANPAVGKIGQVTDQEENKLEFRIKKEKKEEVDKIIKLNHPYECPVINYIQLI